MLCLLKARLPRRTRRLAHALGALMALVAAAIGATLLATSLSHAYVLLEGKPVAHYTGGYKVYVSKGARHRGELTRATKNAVRQLRKHGINVTYAGCRRSDPGKGGTIYVTEQRLRHGIMAQAPYTWYDYNGIGFVARGRVEVSPTAFGKPYTWNVLLHETAHVLGLGHCYRKDQVMCNDLKPYTTYQKRDINGLRAIAATTAWLAKQPRNPSRDWAAQGKLERVTTSKGTATFRGWAARASWSQGNGIVRIYRDGKLVARKLTHLPRTGIRSRAPWAPANSGFAIPVKLAAGKHTYRVYAMDPQGIFNSVHLGSKTISR